MLRKLMGFFVIVFFAVSLAGCATARKQKDMEIQSLKNQVSTLESQLQSKDEEINSLRDSLAKASEPREVVAKKKIIKKRIIGEVKSRPNVKQIQIALSNAGYNPGSIDGNMGKQTIEAVKSFQTANNLPADGKAGKKTWALLKEHLYKQVK